MEESSPSKLPSHPTARAFFAALDAGPKNDNHGKNAISKHSDFVKKRLSTLGWRNRYSQDKYYPMTVGDKTFSVLQIQRGEIEGTYGTGACVWPAAVVLMKYIEQCKELVAGKNVCDLGSGTGVTSVACALLGAKHVICTDGADSVVRLATDNIIHASKEIDLSSPEPTPTASSSGAIMIAGCQMDTQLLWWGKDSLKYFGADATDVVLVADCVLPKLYPIAPLVQAIDELLIKPGALAIVSYEHRYYPDYDPRDKFRECAETKGLVVEAVPMKEHHPIYSVEDIEIWKVHRKN